MAHMPRYTKSGGPKVAIIAVNFLTYCPDVNHPRAEYARECLNSLLALLTYEGGQLIWHIADDGSPQEHRNSLVEQCREWSIIPTVSNSEHRGYGANYNLSTQYTHQADMVLCLEEDWQLIRQFDLTNLANALMAYQGIRCIRLGRIGWTGELRGSLIQVEDQTFLLFDPMSSEHHVFAGGPRLETVDFERKLGPWPEGLRAGTTEWEVCKRLESRIGIAWPLDAGVNSTELHSTLFNHIGYVQAP